jgi:hypothetical protein
MGMEARNNKTTRRMEQKVRVKGFMEKKDLRENLMGRARFWV